MTSYSKGLWAELYTIVYLFCKGYKILAWRYKTPVGEIDIIAQLADIAVCIEVKQRKTVEQALEAVTPKMKERITRAAQYYLSSHKSLRLQSLQFDLLVVSGLKISHVPNAWGYSNRF